LCVTDLAEPRAQLRHRRRIGQLHRAAQRTAPERKRVPVLRLVGRTQESVADSLRPEVEPLANLTPAADAAGVCHRLPLTRRGGIRAAGPRSRASRRSPTPPPPPAPHRAAPSAPRPVLIQAW